MAKAILNPSDMDGRKREGQDRWPWPYFSFDEMSSPDEKGIYLCDEAPGFMRKLVALREEFGRSLVVMSGYRTPHWNALVGGAEKSMHLQGRAVDIWAPRSFDEGDFVRMALGFGFRGIGLKLHGADQGRYIHIDNRDGDLVVWTYA